MKKQWLLMMAAIGFAAAAGAQTFPVKPIRVISEYNAGAGGDARSTLNALEAAAAASTGRAATEISTDDVKASHGATTGALDGDMLFYLLSRGIDPSTARQLLEWAFLEDVLSRLSQPALRRPLELATLAQLGNATAAEALQ